MSIGESSTPLGKVRGLGSAREGGEHWLTERVTSIALLLLGTWFIASLLLLPKLDQRRSSNGCARRAARCRWRCSSSSASSMRSTG